MAKKQIITSENSSAAAGAAPARAEKPTAKRATNTKHSAPKASGSRAVPAGEAQNNATSAAPVAEHGAVELVAVSREEVAKLAYLYWEARGGHGGSAEDDWARAEAELS
jgi:Protein of unknown function (DUF2934)